MKQKKSPIELDTLLFTSYDRHLPDNPVRCLRGMDFNSERHFLIDGDFAGIAVFLRFKNLRYVDGKGVLRKLSLRLFDEETGYEVYSHQIYVGIPAILWEDHKVAIFPDYDVRYGIRRGYSLEVWDDNAGVLLNKSDFHTYSYFNLGNPSHWYQPISAGIKIDGKPELMRSFDAYSDEDRDAYIHFELFDCLPGIDPNNMPELQLHIHHPDNQWIDGALIEPRLSATSSGTYLVRYPLDLLTSRQGIYYAELLCLGEPVAGFAFANDRDIEGTWTVDDLAPIEDLDYEKICQRYQAAISKDSSLP